jgi:predicted patatin/cPLA2 family phospholipase
MTTHHLAPPISTFSVSPVTTALVAEGGGQRGIFTAGVLDAWLENDFDPFDIFIGTSAGSQNITSFLSRQKGYASRIILGLSCNKRFCQFSRGVRGGNVVDLDWYFERTIEGNFALDFKVARKSLGQRELLIAATNSRNRQSYYLKPNRDNNHWRQLLKASSAFPFLYRHGVKLTPSSTVNSINATEPRDELSQADFYLDGGLSAPLPVRHAYERGARKIVVIRTVNADFNTQSTWILKLMSWIYDSGYCPKYIDYLNQYMQAYQQELNFIDNPPNDVEIIQIFAEDNLHSRLLNSTREDLQHDHSAGVDAGSAFLQSHSLF